MTETTTDLSSERPYRYGIDRGMVYPHSMESGVPWKGLISASVSPEGMSAERIYMDGDVVSFELTRGTFTGSIEAFQYPIEFGRECLGEEDLAGIGVTATNQPRGYFDLSYREMVGDENSIGPRHYRIVLITNAVVADYGMDFKTVTEDAEPESTSLDLDAIPTAYVDLDDPETDIFDLPKLPTASLVIDTRRVPPEVVVEIEKILYDDVAPRMVTVDDLRNIHTEVSPAPIRNLAYTPRVDIQEGVTHNVDTPNFSGTATLLVLNEQTSDIFKYEVQHPVSVPPMPEYREVRLAVVEGDYDGPIFDGDDDDTVDNYYKTTYIWENEPRNSPSVMTRVFK